MGNKDVFLRKMKNIFNFLIYKKKACIFQCLFTRKIKQFCFKLDGLNFMKIAKCKFVKNHAFPLQLAKSQPD